MIKILFVCHGNICRSPMAEYVMKDMIRKKGLEEKITVNSAATSTEEIGSPVHQGTKRKLEEEGIECGTHKAVRLTKVDYEKYDYLVGMDTANFQNMSRICGKDTLDKISRLLDFTSKKGDIADPWYTGNFNDTYLDVVEGCEGLLASICETKSKR